MFYQNLPQCCFWSQQKSWMGKRWFIPPHRKLRLFQVIDNDFKIMNFILALIVGSPWHTATFQTNLTDSGDFITLRLLPSPLILNSFFTEGPQKLQNRLHKLTSYEHSHKKRNWIRIKDKAMYVCTRFQSIWRTSVFVTKCAQKNTLGLSIWIEY